ncbi:hypothetical protein BSZ21_17565 [Bradyrhizobium canariense]|nr:hypothetical protein BSZ21_17565 [Bradyrhizobium canariense]
MRTDEYGGSIADRARFAIDIASAIAKAIGPDRTAIRLSPGFTMNGIDECAEGPGPYRYLVTELDKLGLAYVHVLHTGDEGLVADIRALWKRSGIGNSCAISAARSGPPRPLPSSPSANSFTPNNICPSVILDRPYDRGRCWLAEMSGRGRRQDGATKDIGPLAHGVNYTPDRCA